MGINPGTFLSRCGSILTGFGFKKNIPISLYDFHLESSGAPLTTTIDTNAGFDKKGTSSKHTVLTWAATKVVTAGIQVQVPDDYDETLDIFILKLKARMDGADDTTTAFEAAAYKNAASTDLAPDNTADLTATAAWVNVVLSGNSLSAGDNLTIDINPEAHANDAVDVYAVKIEYRSDLVYFDIDERS